MGRLDSRGAGTDGGMARKPTISSGDSASLAPPLEL